MNTIYALSSGSVPAGVAVIRVSGPAAGETIAALCRKPPEARSAALRILRRPSDDAVIDQALVLWFPGPRSETGEDMAEFQVHGGRAVVQAVFDVLAGCGLRLAQPGEFARRAFANGKLDLTEVEGLADLVAAETEVQRRQAIGQAGGELAKRAERWRTELIHLRAEIEARLDFSDESDIAAALPSDFWSRVERLKGEMEEALAGAASGERVREGFRVAIMGRPNAGKSSLLNALARRDVAIVTEEAGTTRDILEIPLDLGGYPVLLFDTAGIREAASLAEQEGVRRARRMGEAADLVLWLEDCTGEPRDLPEGLAGPIWRVATKLDLCPDRWDSGLAISVVTGAGISELMRRLGMQAAESLGRGNALVTRQRQKEALETAIAALSGMGDTAEEVAADLLRSASEAIGRLSGRIDVEDVLDRLFAEFCVGK
jgi:tRNA modification GTPase